MNDKKNSYSGYLFGIIAIIAAIFFDQYTKLLAVTHLKNKNSIDIIEGVFQLHYLENRGAAFGMLQNQKIFFLISGVVILVLAAYFYMKMPHTKHFLPLRVCIVALMSGAVGNMIDRIRLDYVIDFLYFELIDFPIFNVADIYVTLSAASLILLILFFYKDEDFDFLASNKRKKEQAGE